MESPYFTEEHRVFRNTVRRLMAEEVTPHAREWEEAGQFPREVWQMLADNDLLGISFPADYGGLEADFFYSVVFLEEIARSAPGGFAAAVGVHSYIALSYLVRFGSDDLRERYLVPGIEGKKIGALAVSEPDSGSDVAAIRTTARREEKGFVLNGTKTFITNGVQGDFLVVAAKTNPDAGAAGISLLVVDRHSEGLTARPLRKLGWHCSDTAEIFFQDVKVDAAQLIGDENMGFYYLMECFQLERLVAAVTSVAGAEACLQETLKYLNQREAFGRRLAKFQVIRHRLCDLATEIEAARQLTYCACWQYQNKMNPHQACTMAKLYASEVAKKVADTCLQYFGGSGFMEEMPVSRAFRDSRAGTIVGGASEIMREILAKLLIDNVQFPVLAERGTDEVGKPTVAGDGAGEAADALTEAPPVSDISSSNAAAQTNGALGSAAAAAPQQMPAQPSPPQSAEKMAQAPDSAAPDQEDATADEAAPVEFTATTVVGEVFQTYPRRFRPAAAGDYAGNFHFKLTGEDGGKFTVSISPGSCQVQQGLHGKPDCLIETSAQTYLDIEFHKTNPQVAFMMGKIKVSNVSEMIRFRTMFESLPDT